MRRKLQFLSVCLAVLFVAGLALAGPLATNAQAEKKPIKIGFGMALSGPLAPAGKAAVLSMQICVDDFNKKGGVLGRPIKLIYYDDHTRPSDVPAIYTKLITVDKVDFVVSGYGTALIAPALPIVMQRKMIFPGLFGLDANKKFKYKYYFGIAPGGPDAYSDFSIGFFEVAAAQTPKPKTVAVLGVDNEFGLNATDGAIVNAKKQGLKIVYHKRYPPGTVDYTPIMRAVKSLNPDIVYIGSYPGGSVGTLKAAKEVGLKPKIFGGGMVGLQYTAIQVSFGTDLNGVLNYWFWAPEPTLKFPGIEAFLAKYQAQAGKQVLDPLGYYLPPWAYSYMEMLLEAIEATGSMDQKTVGDHLRAYGMDTVVGKTKFSPINGEWVKSRTLMVQIQGVKSKAVSEFAKAGVMKVIWPDKYKSGDLIYPFQGWKK